MIQREILDSIKFPMSGIDEFINFRNAFVEVVRKNVHEDTMSLQTVNLAVLP